MGSYDLGKILKNIVILYLWKLLSYSFCNFFSRNVVKYCHHILGYFRHIICGNIVKYCHNLLLQYEVLLPGQY